MWLIQNNATGKQFAIGQIKLVIFISHSREDISSQLREVMLLIQNHFLRNT